MDLKEKFDSVIMRHDLCRNEFEETKEQCAEIAEEIAIDFAKWIYLEGRDMLIYKGIRSVEELLKEYKNKL